MKINHIIIHLTDFTDVIHLETDLPSPYPIMGFPAKVKIETQQNYAEQYCKINFPNVPIHAILDLR